MRASAQRRAEARRNHREPGRRTEAPHRCRWACARKGIPRRRAHRHGLGSPRLEEIRKDLKTGVFDAIHFLDIDRIMRDVAHQMVLLGDLLKHGKQVVIKGKDYVNNPENKFAVTVLGAVAELERTKIIERMDRGRLYRLRMGEMSSNGHRIYGYHYVKKMLTSPAALVINEEQAAIVRSIFELFASGRYGLVTISRFLEEHRIPTRTGRTLWLS